MENSNYDFTGVYNVVISSEFEQPEILGGSSTITRTIEFTMTVTPCTVTSFDVVDSINSFTYILGTPERNFGPYGFQQTPDCGYVETVSFENLPLGPNLTHDSVNQEFTLLENSDYTFTAVYNVVITSEFE